MEQMIITVSRGGTISYIHNDRLNGLLAHGEARITRASHVEPDVTPEGIRWYADLSPVGGPKLTGFHTREEALHAEVDWLNLNNLGRSHDAKNKTWPALNNVVDRIIKAVLEGMRDAVCTDCVSLSVIQKRVKMYTSPRATDDEITTAIKKLEEDKVLVVTTGDFVAYSINLDTLAEKMETYNKVEAPALIWLVIQQGGSSAEFYASTYDDMESAEEAIKGHKEASYDAFGPYLFQGSLTSEQEGAIISLLDQVCADVKMEKYSELEPDDEPEDEEVA